MTDLLCRWLRPVALGLTLAFAAQAPARADDPPVIDPADASLTVTIDAPTPEPYRQEMLLVRVHGVYTVTITLENLEQPPFQGFAWMQLGRDKWGEAEIDGRRVRTFDRVMAVFPDRVGRMSVDTFVHHLTLLAEDGHRFRYDVLSKPVSIAVLAPPAHLVGDWWLPARKLTLTDSFDREPDQLAPGDVAHRTVTLVAEGIGADLLPPMPKLVTPGVFALPEPEERSTQLTNAGPVSTVVWRWTVRPVKGDTGDLATVDIPWFDTLKRSPAKVVIGARRVALASAETTGETGGTHWLLRHQGLAAATTASLGFLAALALLLRGRRFVGVAALAQRLSRWLPDLDLTALRRAARKGDIAGVRASARRWADRRGGALPTDVATQLAALDRHLFAQAPAEGFDPRDLIRAIRAAG